jgi:hypothetical protein
MSSLIYGTWTEGRTYILTRSESSRALTLYTFRADRAFEELPEGTGAYIEAGIPLIITGVELE